MIFPTHCNAVSVVVLSPKYFYLGCLLMAPKILLLRKILSNIVNQGNLWIEIANESIAHCTLTSKACPKRVSHCLKQS